MMLAIPQRPLLHVTEPIPNTQGYFNNGNDKKDAQDINIYPGSETQVKQEGLQCTNAKKDPPRSPVVLLEENGSSLHI